MDLIKVKSIVDTLVKGKVIDLISETMDQGFGEVSFKITIQNGAIKLIGSTKTKTVKFD